MKKKNAASNITLPNTDSAGKGHYLKNETFWHCVLLTLLPVLVYYQIIGYDFTNFDDSLILKKKNLLSYSFENIRHAFQSDAFLRIPGSSFYRPFQSLSFMFDNIAGNGGLWMFHLTNLIIHILTSITLYFFLDTFKIQKTVALFFALLFSVHPLFASAVSWIPARGDLLIGLGGMLLFQTFVKYFITGKKKFFILHSILFFLMIFTKETTILFPVILGMYFLFFLKKDNPVKSVFPYAGVWVSAIAIVFFIRNKVLTDHVSNEAFGFTAFFNNLSVIPVTVGKIFFPENLSTLCLFDTSSLIVGAVFLFLLLFLLFRSIAQRQWVTGIGFTWFLLFTIPPMFSSVHYTGNFFQYLEHRTYLPSIGIIIMLSSLLQDQIQKIHFWIFTSVGSVVLLIFSLIASAHSKDYKDSFAFYTSAIESSPQKNAYAYTNRGIEYGNLHDYVSAVADQESALNILKNYELYYNKGCIEMDAGANEKAEEDFTASIALKNNLSTSYINRSTVLYRQGKYAEAKKDIDTAERLGPENDMTYCKKGNILFKLGQVEEAVDNYTKCINLNQENNEAWNKRAMALYRLKKYDMAIRDCKKLLELNVENDVAYNNMGLIYLELTQYTEAIDCFTRSLGQKEFSDTYFNRGRAELKMGRLADACKDWDRSLQMGFVPAKDSINKYCR